MSPAAGAGGRTTLAVAALIWLWLAATAGARPLMLPDEGRYVGVAWEMVRSGEWLTPTLNGLPYFHKPPLFYWITAGSLSLFGLHEWAARAAPLLGAWLAAFALYLFVRRWWGERAARLALVALLVQPLFYIGGQFANMDMLVAGCISASILLLAHAALSFERELPYRRALAGAYALAALGVLAKGLIGAVIPALVLVAWLLMRTPRPTAYVGLGASRKRVLMALLWWPGVLLFVLLAVPWFGVMQLRFADFLDYFFVVQHFKRFAAGGFNNLQPFWFYPAVLVLFSLPWLPWLYRLFTRRYLSDPERGPIRLLMVLWLLVVLLFFSWPKSKLLGYILPAVPPLALLMADGLLSLSAPSPRARRLWWASAGVAAAASVGAVLAISIFSSRSTRELASVLGAQRGAQDSVLMLNNYYFDVPFYAGIRGPIKVVDDWASPDVERRDNWRKELADAARFAPTLAAAALITPLAIPLALPAAVCGAPVSWVIGAATHSSRYPFLAQARVVFSQRETTLWRLDAAAPAAASAPGCAERPNADSTDR